MRQLILIFLTWTVVSAISPHRLQVGDSPQAIYTECGGLVTITRTDNPSIEYKHGANYENNERCVWTILPEKDHALSSIIVIVESTGFSINDGLIFYWWSIDGVLNGRKILTADIGQAITLTNTHHAFLYFSSDDQTVGDGFKVDIIGLQGGTVGTDETKFIQFSTCAQSFFYPKFSDLTYKNDEKLSVVLQPVDGTALTFVKFGYADLEHDSDIVKVYELKNYSNEDLFILNDSITGLIPEGLPAVNSTDPRLILFKSDGSNTNRGFYFDWY